MSEPSSSEQRDWWLVNASISDANGDDAFAAWCREQADRLTTPENVDSPTEVTP